MNNMLGEKEFSSFSSTSKKVNFIAMVAPRGLV